MQTLALCGQNCMHVHPQSGQKWNTVKVSKGCIKYVSLRNISLFSTITKQQLPREKTRSWLILKHTALHIIPWSFWHCTILPSRLLLPTIIAANYRQGQVTLIYLKLSNDNFPNNHHIGVYVTCTSLSLYIYINLYPWATTHNSLL